MKRLCIIPARGGSKRIPGKNIKIFCGKPIIAYSIEAARKSGLFDEVMVSTDDFEIAAIARTYGAAVPFMRSISNADDHAPLANVILECLELYSENGQNYESVLCLLATAPFVTATAIVDAYHKFEEGRFDSLIPVVRFSFPILRAFNLKMNLLSMVWPEFRDTRSQDLDPAFHDTGTFYWINVLRILKERTILMPKTGGIEVSEFEVQDIDTEEDWRIAEFKFIYRSKS